eukprot:Anaeramoba_ignava/a229677_13.p2 GENE.a229677_13~~a229677_13.p2  ORF type:complete len:191 (-),score=26.95 a229677_13:975-1547(-)
MSKMHEILVVDDDRAILDVLKIGIHEKGYKVSDYTNGEDALVNFQPGRYRYALLDIKLPGMDGIELSNELGKLDPSMIIILMTGYPDIQDVINAIRSRVFDYLIKPFRLSQLFIVLEKAEQSIKINAENTLLKKYVTHLKKENEELRQKLKKLSPMVFKVNENKFPSKDQVVNSYKQNQDDLLFTSEDES